MRPLFLTILFIWASSFQFIFAAPGVLPRIIKFPTREVGIVSFGIFKQPHLEWNFDQRSLISAKGNVRIPGDAKVNLKLNWYGTENLDWVKDLRPDDLEAMDFESMPLTSTGLQQVAHLSGLKHLFLEDTDIVDSDCLAIAKLRNLVDLRISRTGITGKEFRKLSECKNLQKLEAGFNKLNDQSLSDLKFFPNLKRLDLARSNLTDRSLVFMRDLKGIKYLSLRGNRDFKDKSIRLLPSRDTLVGLDLTGVSITANASLELQALKKLRALRLDGERFGPADRAKFQKNLPLCEITYAISKSHIPIEVFRPLH